MNNYLTELYLKRTEMDLQDYFADWPLNRHKLRSQPSPRRYDESRTDIADEISNQSMQNLSPIVNQIAGDGATHRTTGENGMTTNGLKTTSSQGHHGSAIMWLDTHFQAAQAEYLEILSASEIRQGMHVLDAGTGSGSFLPFLAEMVGPDGKITAFDIAPENVAQIAQRAAAQGFPCSLATEVGSVTNLPFSSDKFDAVWCANVTLYLSDEEFINALQQCQRVVKPGGLVAIKEVDLGMTRLQPAPYGLFWRLLEASNKTGRPVHVHGALRAQHLKRTMERLGLEDVRQHTTLIERWAPLRDVERTYLTGILRFFAEYALELELPADDGSIWAALAGEVDENSVIESSEFYWCEASILAVGTVP